MSNRSSKTPLTPTIRPRIRNGRGSFLRTLRERVAKVRVPPNGAPYREKVLAVIDAAAAKYAE